MQPSFQAPCNTASPDRFSCRDTGCFRNRGCRDLELKNIGSRLGRDSVAAGSFVSSTVKVPLRCIAILFEATAIDSFMFTDRVGGVMARFPRLPRSLLAVLLDQRQKCGSFHWSPCRVRSCTRCIYPTGRQSSPRHNDCSYWRRWRLIQDLRTQIISNRT
jgi:hypothetical protein